MFHVARTSHPFLVIISYEAIEFFLLAMLTLFDFWDVMYLSLLSFQWIVSQSLKIVLLCLPGFLILEDSKGCVLIPLLLSGYTHLLYDFILSHGCVLSILVLPNELQYKLSL